MDGGKSTSATKTRAAHSSALRSMAGPKPRREPRRRRLRKRLELGQPVRDTADTLGRFAGEWIATALAASERKASTKAMYASVARSQIVSSALGGLPLGKITPRAVEGWLVELRGKGLAESTVRISYAILLAILSTAVRDGALGRIRLRL